MAARKENTEAKICTQLSEVRQALSAVADLTPSSTVGEAKEAEMGLSTAIANLEGSEQKLEQLRTKAFQDQLNSPALWSARNPNNPEVGGLARRTLGWPCDLAMQSCLGYIPLGCSERRRNRTGIPSAG